jgi:large subunit ribosomal protein L17
MGNTKLGRPTEHRLQVIRNQASQVLWNGRIETTHAYAKATQRIVEKIITMAIKGYTDVKKVEKEVTNAKGVKVKKTVLEDGAKKLTARRRIMALVYDLFEVRNKKESKRSFDKRTRHINHPLVEKIFNEIAPKYDARAKELKQGGGYTRVIRTGNRVGDDAMMAIIELV